MIYADFVRPVPSPEIVKRLKQIDDRLDLKYFVWPSRDYANTNMTQNWGIIQRWSQTDKRRQMIQLGQMKEDDDFDVLCWLPIDCSVEQAHDYLLRACKGKFKSSKDIEYVLNNIAKWNKEAAIPQEVKELAEELIESNAKTLFKEEGKHIPQVFMSGGNLKKK